MSSTFTPWPPDLADHYRRIGLWEGIDVAAMVARTAARNPGKTAVVSTSERLSYETMPGQRPSGSLARAATSSPPRASTRSAFVSHGLRAGDRVVVQLPNIVEFVVVYLALNRIGAIPVMALRAHRHAEVRHFLRASGAVAYVIADVVGGFDFRTMAREMAAEFSVLASVFVVGEPLAGQHALRDLVGDRRTIAGLRVDPSRVSTMLLSGGTTSMSKLIPRTHDDYVLNARLCGAAAGFDARTVFMAILPLGHNYNLASPGILGTFRHGGTVVIAPSTDTDTLFAMVVRERVTVLAAAVPLISNWLNDRVAERFDLKFQGDFFNAPNVTNYNGVNVVTSNSSFGTISSAYPPRNIQLSLKLAF